MKQEREVFYLLTIISCFSISHLKTPDSSCSSASFPVEDIKHCCFLPRYTNLQFERVCFSQCSRFAHDFEKNKNCILNCMVYELHLLNGDGRLNKFSVKKMYSSNLDRRRNWTRLVDEAVEKCDSDQLNSLETKLKLYFGCVETHLAVNCIDFKEWLDECHEIEDHFDSCRNGSLYEFDCSRVPIDIMNARGDCCIIPQLISNETVRKCQKDCTSIEFLEPLVTVCMENCFLKETGLKVNGRIDYNVVKALLLNNAVKNSGWNERIDFAVDNCRKVVQGELRKMLFQMFTLIDEFSDMEYSRLQHNALFTSLKNCLISSLSKNCPLYRKTRSCNRLKRFMEKCPIARIENFRKQ